MSLLKNYKWKWRNPKKKMSSPLRQMNHKKITTLKLINLIPPWLLLPWIFHLLIRNPQPSIYHQCLAYSMGTIQKLETHISLLIKTLDSVLVGVVFSCVRIITFRNHLISNCICSISIQSMFLNTWKIRKYWYQDQLVGIPRCSCGNIEKKLMN